MNVKKAKQILGNKSIDELREILSYLDAKEFLWLETDIEKKQAALLLLKQKVNAK